MMGAETSHTLAELPQKGDIVAGGKYRIERLVGQGGMGAVFVGVHTTLGTRVAIKWMLPKFSSDYTAVQRFLREATIAAKIRHPNVVQPIDVSDDPSKPFIIMELLEGQSLAKYVAEGRLYPVDIGRIFIPVLEAVIAAHQHNVIHRDLKLDNIFLSDGGSGGIIPKVLDFGIAKTTDKGTFATITQDHSVLGTVQYMSPEQIVRPSDVNEQTDVYALGVILYRLISGTFPHQAENILDLALRIRDTAPTPLSKHLSSIPPALESAIGKALATSTEQRFPDVKSFRDAIVPYLGQNQEWMKNCKTNSAREIRSKNQTTFEIAATSTSGADCSIPSSLHSLELESYTPPRNMASRLWVPVLAVVVALLGTFIWLKLQKPETKTFANQPRPEDKRLDEKIKASTRETPKPPDEPAQPQPKESDDEWPSLAKAEDEQEVKEIKQDEVTVVKQDEVTVVKKDEPVQPSAYPPPVPTQPSMRFPAPPPTESLEPSNRRKITYKRYSGASSRSQTSRRRSSQSGRARPPSTTEPNPSSGDSSKAKSRFGDLSLDDF